MLKRPRRRCEGTTMGGYHCSGLGISLFFSRLWRYEFHHCWTRSGSDQFMQAYCEILCYFHKDGVPVQGNFFGSCCKY
ncbi:hypothetical protein HanPI659440_Chr11g0412991 [Helianthus annuus]|nr:hypothetical protein HanPI659440_Chr11g0412991 [Helianthus annuus]